MGTALQGDGAVYEINYSVPSSDKLGEALNELFAEIQRHLWFAGIPLAIAGQSSVSRLAIPTSADLLGADLLGQSDLFGVIAFEDCRLIAGYLSEVWLEVGEILMSKASKPKGAIHHRLRHRRKRSQVIGGDARMGPSGSIGAIGLIMDAPFAATATALTPVKAYSLSRDAIAAAIAARPELASDLEALARRGHAAMKSDATVHEVDRGLKPPEMFLSRMRSFLMKLAVGDAP